MQERWRECQSGATTNSIAVTTVMQIITVLYVESLLLYIQNTPSSLLNLYKECQLPVVERSYRMRSRNHTVLFTFIYLILFLPWYSASSFVQR